MLPPVINVNNVSIGGGNPLVLIAGPCVIESKALIEEVAGYIKEVSGALSIPFIFKSSFDKANRTSINSFRGPGLADGLIMLKDVKDKFNIPITTDIHLPEQAARVAEVVDLLQIPAFLCRQTDLLVAAAKSGAAVSVKKGQFLAPWDMSNVIAKLSESGCDKIILIERGSSFGYNNLVVDMGGLSQMRSLGAPVIFDATHSVQLPGGDGFRTGGRRELIPPLARAAVAAGVDGLFLEVHPDPDNAKSDGPNALKLSQLKELLEQIIEIDRLRVARESR